MLLQELRRYADEQLDLPPPMYQEQPVRYIIQLTEDGRMVGPPIDTADADNKRGKRILVPYIKRVNVRPKLLADNAAYVLGLAEDESKVEWAKQQHDAFVALTSACAVATGEPTVRAVERFLTALKDEPVELPQRFNAAAILTFRVGETFPIDIQSVRAFWASETGADTDRPQADPSNANNIMACVVCSEIRPVLQRHPLKIKGVPGGHPTGTDLISADRAAFESYGLDKSLIAPTCLDCALKYGNALNALLSQRETHLEFPSVVYAFWTARGHAFNSWSLFSDPKPEEAQQLINAYQTGARAALSIEAPAFFAMSLGASGGRVVVREWITATIEEVKQQFGRYFALQEIVDWDGSPGTPLPVSRLVTATVRDPRKDAVPMVPDALLRLALRGTPLPLEVLTLVLQRIRAEGSVNQARAALIKMVLGSQPGADERMMLTMADLDSGNQSPAYLYGRLLAVLDAIQRRALGNPNTTLVDRYYGTASSAPASVFGTLLHGAQPHLAKLRKTPSTKSAQIALQRRLEEIMDPLTEFKATLTLQEQGLFALGFYHQRAADRRAIEEYKRAKAEGRLNPSDPDAGMADVPDPDEVVSAEVA